MLTDSRRCTKCSEIKALSEFSKAPRGKYGVKASCKSCDAARHALLAASRIPRKRGRPRGEPIDPSSPKQCNECGIVKPHSDFSLSRRATDTQNAVYRSGCKQCASKRAIQWFKDNPERTAENARRHNLGRYGLTIEEYDALLAAQGHVCAICGNKERTARKGAILRMPVDHCHDTGRVRGILCTACNRALGLLGDNVDVLRKAVDYLERE